MRFMLGMFAGVVFAGLLFGLSQPHCPTEDSCKPTFSKQWFGGYWSAVEDTP